MKNIVVKIPGTEPGIVLFATHSVFRTSSEPMTAAPALAPWLNLLACCAPEKAS